MPVNFDDVMFRLESLADPEKVEIKRNKFGIEATNALGIYQCDLKVLAKEIGTGPPRGLPVTR